MNTMLTLTVPRIPSVNHYTAHTRKGRHYKTKEARAFEQAVIAQLLALKWRIKPTPWLHIVFTLNKDFGKRDLDNMPKVFLDCLAKVCRFNDAKIEKLVLKKEFDRNLPVEVIAFQFLEVEDGRG